MAGEVLSMNVLDINEHLSMLKVFRFKNHQKPYTQYTTY